MSLTIQRSYRTIASMMAVLDDTEEIKTETGFHPGRYKVTVYLDDNQDPITEVRPTIVAAVAVREWVRRDPRVTVVVITDLHTNEVLDTAVVR